MAEIDAKKQVEGGEREYFESSSCSGLLPSLLESKSNSSQLSCERKIVVCDCVVRKERNHDRT